MLQRLPELFLCSMGATGAGGGGIGDGDGDNGKPTGVLLCGGVVSQV